mgnify:CR=1 FL=1
MEVTLDGSVDIHGKLAPRRATGGVKRSFFILGKFLAFQWHTFLF